MQCSSQNHCCPNREVTYSQVVWQLLYSLHFTVKYKCKYYLQGADLNTGSAVWANKDFSTCSNSNITVHYDKLALTWNWEVKGAITRSWLSSGKWVYSLLVYKCIQRGNNKLKKKAPMQNLKAGFSKYLYKWKELQDKQLITKSDFAAS